jgi:hypothetical protein
MRSIIAVVVLSLAAVAGNAQVTRTPVTNSELQKMAATKKVVVVEPLQQEEKLNRVRELMKGRIRPLALKNLTLAPTYTMSVGNPVKDANDFLKFVLPWQVSPLENLASFQDVSKVGQSGVFIFFNAPSDGFYVLDFVTDLYTAFPSSPVTLNLTGYMDNESQNQTLTKNGVQHIIFVSKQVKTGLNWYFLSGVKTDWIFHSVDISQFVVGS